MSEQLRTYGRAGAEEIARIVNGYFAQMIGILHQNGGALIKLGSGALLGLFVGRPQDTARYAVQAALDMQQDMVLLMDREISMGRIELQMKAGIHTGRVFTAHIGMASQMEYWVTGEDADHVALTEDAAEEGQIVVSHAARQYLLGWIDVRPLPHRSNLYELAGTSAPRLVSVWKPQVVGSPQLVGAFSACPVEPARTSSGLRRSQVGQCMGFQTSTRLVPRPVVKDFVSPRNIFELTHRLDILVPYLPVGLLDRLVHNPSRCRVGQEHRLVTVLFVNVMGFSKLASALTPGRVDALTETMQDYFTTMQFIVEEHRGAINKINLSPTGDTLLVTFGASVAYEDSIGMAACAADAMQTALKRINQRLAARCPGVQVFTPTHWVFDGLCVHRERRFGNRSRVHDHR